MPVMARPISEAAPTRSVFMREMLYRRRETRYNAAPEAAIAIRIERLKRKGA